MTVRTHILHQVISNGEATILHLRTHGLRHPWMTGMDTTRRMAYDQAHIIRVIPGHLRNIQTIHDHQATTPYRRRGITHLHQGIILLHIIIRWAFTLCSTPGLGIDKTNRLARIPPTRPIITTTVLQQI
jgi:hypothetical protein